MDTAKKFSFFIVLCVILVDWMGLGFVYPMFSSMLFNQEVLLLPYTASHSLRGFVLGLLLAGMPFAQFFSAPILGTLSDQMGRKRLLLWTLLVGVLGYAVSYVAVRMVSVVLLILSRVIIGISAGNAAVVAATIADLSTPKEKAKNFGLYNMALGLGLTIGPFLGGMISSYKGYSMPFLVAGATTLLNFFLVFFFFQETNLQLKKRTVSWIAGILNIKKAFHLKGLRILFLVIFFFIFGWSFFYEFIPVTWITEYNFTAAHIGMLYAYGSAFYALSAGFLIRFFVNKFKPFSVLFYSLLFLGCYIFILLIKPAPIWLWLYSPWIQFFIALIFPTSTTLVSNSVDSSSQGEVLGVMQSIQSAGFVVSPLISGTLLGISTQMPVIVGGLAMLLAALILKLYGSAVKDAAG